MVILIILTFVPAILLLGLGVIHLVKAAKEYKTTGERKKYPFMPIAVIGALISIGAFLWLTVPYYLYVFYENGQTNGILLLLWPTAQAIMVSIPTHVVALILALFSKRRNQQTL